ncbi:MAG: tRNA-dihydrouridine synthase family protein [Tepidisphaeraceae bacterium]
MSFKLGLITISRPFCQAGLAGYSDRAMRVVARRRGCAYALTESLLDTIMLCGGMGLKKSIDINDEDHPVAGQIVGSDPETMAPAAKILNDRGYDVIDLNFACPVKKIKNKARGGHMLRDVPRALAVMRAVREIIPTERPITVSLRKGFDDSAQSRDAFFEIVEEAWRLGFAAIRVHGRTVEQKYLGRADWDFLRQLKLQYPHRLIFGSGDVFTAEDAVRMLRDTGVDCAWIARGAIGNPWIFRHAADLLTADDPSRASVPAGLECPTVLASGRPARTLALPTAPPTIHAQRDALREHFAIAMEIHGEQLAGRRMRKQGIKYARFHPLAAEVKGAFINVVSLRQWNEVLTRFYEADGSGIWPRADAVDEVNDGLASCETE